MDLRPMTLFLRVIACYIPIIRKIPITINKTHNNTFKVIVLESEKIIKEKYDDDKNNKLDGNDLLSLLFKVNKTLPIEKKMTDVEIKHQVEKTNIFFF